MNWHDLLHLACGGIGFLALITASASGSRVLNVAFACAVVLAFAWISALSVRLYQRAQID